jgi:hypothetical protein
MYMHVSKCENDKIKKWLNKGLEWPYQEGPLLGVIAETIVLTQALLNLYKNSKKKKSLFF